MVNKEESNDTTSNINELDALNTVDNEERDETIPRGNEWEVVSLTASAYADDSIHEENIGTTNDSNEAETSRALFMSHHFVFPPSQHENLPLERDNSEIPKSDEVSTQIEGKYEKEDEHWNLGNLNVDDKELDMFDTNKFSSFHSGDVIDGPTVYDENVVASDVMESFDDESDVSSIRSDSSKCCKDEFNESKLPCGAWWKRGMSSICGHAKESSTYWSIFVAATVMGLVLLGQRWQHERWQVLQQRWQLSIGDEKSGRILSRLKEVIIGGSRRGTYITASSGEH